MSAIHFVFVFFVFAFGFDDSVGLGRLNSFFFLIIFFFFILLFRLSGRDFTEQFRADHRRGEFFWHRWNSHQRWEHGTNARWHHVSKRVRPE